MNFKISHLIVLFLALLLLPFAASAQGDNEKRWKESQRVFFAENPEYLNDRTKNLAFVEVVNRLSKTEGAKKMTDTQLLKIAKNECDAIFFPTGRPKASGNQANKLANVKTPTFDHLDQSAQVNSVNASIDPFEEGRRLWKIDHPEAVVPPPPAPPAPTAVEKPTTNETVNIIGYMIVCLSVPFLIRYAILRRPLQRKWTAITIIFFLFVMLSSLAFIFRYDMEYIQGPLYRYDRFTSTVEVRRSDGSGFKWVPIPRYKNLQHVRDVRTRQAAEDRNDELKDELKHAAEDRNNELKHELKRAAEDRNDELKRAAEDRNNELKHRLEEMKNKMERDKR